MGLTKDQQAALERCLDGENVFITGGGGVGKTYLIKQIVDKMKMSGRSVMLTAPTGRAAQLIGGSTCHRAFKIPLKMAWKKDPQHRHPQSIISSITFKKKQGSLPAFFSSLLSLLPYLYPFRAHIFKSITFN